MHDIAIKIIRRVCIGGEGIDAGAVLRVSAETAADLLSPGRVELVNADDLPRVLQAAREALEADTRRVLGRIAGRAPDPWIPIGG